LAATDGPARPARIDARALRRKYARERDKRLRPDGNAQYIRLAWSIDTGHPVEQPTAVACRYTSKQQSSCS